MSRQTYSDFHNNFKPETCTVCQEDVNAGPFRASCGHVFCFTCAKSWFETAATCPSCRTELYDESTIPDDMRMVVDDNIDFEMEEEDEEEEDDEEDALALELGHLQSTIELLDETHVPDEGHLFGHIKHYKESRMQLIGVNHFGASGPKTVYVHDEELIRKASAAVHWERSRDLILGPSEWKFDDAKTCRNEWQRVLDTIVAVIKHASLHEPLYDARSFWGRLMSSCIYDLNDEMLQYDEDFRRASRVHHGHDTFRQQLVRVLDYVLGAAKEILLERECSQTWESEEWTGLGGQQLGVPKRHPEDIAGLWRQYEVDRRATFARLRGSCDEYYERDSY